MVDSDSATEICDGVLEAAVVSNVLPRAEDVLVTTPNTVNWSLLVSSMDAPGHLIEVTPYSALCR